jgi:hypothetical protein
MQLGYRIVVSGSFLLVGGVREIRSVYAVPPDTLNNASQKRCHTHINLLVITVHHGQVTGSPAPVLGHIMKGFRRELISRARSTALTPVV